MKVADLMAGGGYTTELLSRAAGPTGTVYGENPKWVLEKFAEKPWSERLTRVPNTKRLDRELDDPFPAEPTGTLDVGGSNASYHDSVWLNADRLELNQAVLRALKMGGAYVVCDSSAKAGAGVSKVKTLHRIEAQVVRDGVTKAGFTFERAGDFLRHPADPRDWSASPAAAEEKRGTGDRFCFRFVKPTVFYRAAAGRPSGAVSTDSLNEPALFDGPGVVQARTATHGDASRPHWCTHVRWPKGRHSTHGTAASRSSPGGC